MLIKGNKPIFKEKIAVLLWQEGGSLLINLAYIFHFNSSLNCFDFKDLKVDQLCVNR